MTGIAGNICVLFTANDAYMRGLRIYAPVDCIVSNTADDNEYALRQIEIVLKGRTEPSSRLTFSRASAAARAGDDLTHWRLDPRPILTLVMLALFGLFLAGQVVTGW